MPTRSAGERQNWIAGALLVPSSLALIMDTYPEEERSAAIGSWTAFTGVATVIHS